MDHPSYLIFNPIHDDYEYISHKVTRSEQCHLIDDKTQKLYNLKILDLRKKILFLKNIRISLDRC